MSKRATNFSVWGFYLGVVISSFSLPFWTTDSSGAPSIVFIFFGGVAVSILGAILGWVLNRSGRPDTKLETWEVLRETLTQNFGIGLIPLLFIAMIFAVLSGVFQIHLFGF